MVGVAPPKMDGVPLDFPKSFLPANNDPPEDGGGLVPACYPEAN
jgi:hypothetical protein